MPSKVLLVTTFLCLTSPCFGGLNFLVDYQYDSGGFFNDATRRDAFDAALRILNKYVDDLEPVIPDENNSWSTIISKPDGSGTVLLSDVPVPEDTVILYPAGMNLPGRLAQSIDLAGLGNGTPEFEDAVRYRGEEGASATPATDFGVIGGTISFNSNSDDVRWHFGVGTRRLDPNEFDFITVAMHEILHVMGIGISKSWNDHTNNQDEFFGTEARSVGSSTNPTLALDQGGAHWRRGTKGNWNGIRQEALLAPAIAPGQRQFPTDLDRAAMRDIGWEEAPAGDATLDRIFDSSDLITMFRAGMFETELLAGWSDGDFNGDAVFDSGDLIYSLANGTYIDAATPDGSDQVDADPRAVTVTYDRNTGELKLDSEEQLLTTFEVRSFESNFDGMGENLDGLFDVNRADKIFKMDPGGFADISFGQVFSDSLNGDLLSDDLLFDGTYQNGGRLLGVNFQMVPEPNSLLLFALGIFGILRSRR